MARFNEQSKVPNLPDQEGTRHFGDGIAGPIVATRIQAFDSSTLTYIDVAVDATGQLKTTGAAGGGGAATIADGADVAQGATTDAASASTVVGLLKAIKAAVQGVLNTDVSDRVGRLLGHVTIDNATLTVDTELPAAVALSDNVANPTAPMVGGGTMLWDSTLNAGAGGWSRAPGSVTAGMKVQSGQLPAALAANGGLKVEGVAGGVAQPISAAALPLPAGAAADATLTGGTMKTKLVDSGGATVAAIISAADSAAGQNMVATMGFNYMWNGTSWDRVRGDTTAGVKVAQPGSSLCVTTISVANTGITLTLPAPAAGLFHYITSIEIVNINPTITAIAAAASLLSYTTTNLPGSPVWNCGTLLAAGAEKLVTRLAPTTPLKSSAAATATTIIAPAIGAGGQCRITVTYYTAP